MVVLRDRRVWLTILGASLTAAVVIVGMHEARSEPPDPSSTSTSSSVSDPLESSLSCAQGEPILSQTDSLSDVAGGYLTPAEAMGGYLQQFGLGISILDVQQVVLIDNTNPEYVRYRYMNPASGGTILLFELNVVGDSWHVTDWIGCADQVPTVLDLEDGGPPPGID